MDRRTNGSTPGAPAWQIRDYYADMKYMPLDLRPKKTRAIRRRLSPDQVHISKECKA